MTAETESAGLRLEASDVTGQKLARLPDVPADTTVGELVNSLLARMCLPPYDPNGRPLAYQARLEREGRHLHASERVGDALVEDDRIVLQPSIDAA